ncbi:carboxypeptidase-like regulatory domain-containing protein [Blastopirellula retiformator]|uniref:Nickel uptake substrate-specific transmembrane region n=1 Tax=Blastopirellula retiformator TaxID=2527970 RepID=A0A5C5UZV2_9BACT|nr:carboxypeptidase-like regulatory domain-containing protein [Blastopirellula retiformator]TWT31894.1 hypothetical protein Enr8_38190 [Blastopirellula retiformator]
MPSRRDSFYDRRCAFAICLGLLGIAGLGCSADPHGPDATVTGTVTQAGQPLVDAMVAFEPAADKGRGAFGLTDAQGRYELRFDSQRMGVKSGEYVVYITDAQLADDGAARTTGRIPKKYGENSPLQRTVEPGGNTIDFVLESK